MTSGYTKRSLYQKLGYKENMLVNWVNTPSHYRSLLTDLPAIKLMDNQARDVDFIHVFCTSAELMKEQVIRSKDRIKQNGIIWVSWPKKSSKVLSDITEDVVREFALLNGLVDVKVCTVDETWSALKLVIPVKLRQI